MNRKVSALKITADFLPGDSNISFLAVFTESFHGRIESKGNRAIP